MSLFNIHKHEFEEYAKTYNPPTVTNPDAVFSTMHGERKLHGSTVFIFKCQKCDKFKEIEVLGQEVQNV